MIGRSEVWIRALVPTDIVEAVIQEAIDTMGDLGAKGFKASIDPATNIPAVLMDKIEYTIKDLGECYTPSDMDVYLSRLDTIIYLLDQLRKTVRYDEATVSRQCSRPDDHEPICEGCPNLRPNLEGGYTCALSSHDVTDKVVF